MSTGGRADCCKRHGCMSRESGSIACVTIVQCCGVFSVLSVWTTPAILVQYQVPRSFVVRGAQGARDEGSCVSLCSHLQLSGVQHTRQTEEGIASELLGLGVSGSWLSRAANPRPQNLDPINPKPLDSNP